MRPRVRMVPWSGRITPLIILSRVLLPEPLRPISPMDSPCSTVNETSLTARNFSVRGSLLRRGDRHLLERAVVLHRELLGHVLHDDRLLAHQRRSGNLPSTREKNRWASHSRATQMTSMITAALPQVGREGPITRCRSGDGVAVVLRIEARTRTAAASAGRLRRAGWPCRAGRAAGCEACSGVDAGEGVHHRHQEVHELQDRATMFWKSRKNTLNAEKNSAIAMREAPGSRCPGGRPRCDPMREVPAAEQAAHHEQRAPAGRCGRAPRSSRPPGRSRAASASSSPARGSARSTGCRPSTSR